MGWVVNATHRPLYPRERDPVPIVQEASRLREIHVNRQNSFLDILAAHTRTIQTALTRTYPQHLQNRAQHDLTPVSISAHGQPQE
jgi:hypothetical protein